MYVYLTPLHVFIKNDHLGQVEVDERECVSTNESLIQISLLHICMAYNMMQTYYAEDIQNDLQRLYHELLRNMEGYHWPSPSCNQLLEQTHCKTQVGLVYVWQLFSMSTT